MQPIAYFMRYSGTPLRFGGRWIFVPPGLNVETFFQLRLEFA